MTFTALELIDKLIDTWELWEDNEDYYLAELAPAIVRGDTASTLSPKEKKIVAELRELLAGDEWADLPRLIARRRKKKLQELESDRLRNEARLERLRQEEELRRKQEEERARREQELRARKDALVARINYAFETDFLSSSNAYRIDHDRDLLTLAQFSELQVGFVQDWSKNEIKMELDLEQAAAAAAIEGDLQVIARAGAGKTRTLVARALFLQEHCKIAPCDLLLLAFNRDAALEMQNRLKESLPGDVPHVMTFHALAYALVHPEEDLIYDDRSSGNQALSRLVQEVIDDHLRSDQFRPLIHEVMLDHFRDDWEKIVEGGFHLPTEELIEYRKSLPRESLKGDYVKSWGERLIANTLFENDIEYKYERNFRWRGTNYRPDFTILEPGGGGIVIEYFGLKGDRDYDQMSAEKRKFWAQKKGWTFLEFSPSDLASLGPESFGRRLLKRLRDAGVEGHRLSEEEIWQRIRRRAIDHFTAAMTTFVGRCRKSNFSPEQLHELVERHLPITDAEGVFLELGESIHQGYLKRLESNHQDDFDGLLWRAVELLEQGRSRFSRDQGRERGDLRSLRYVLVDEFQDFSQPFDAMLQAIRRLNQKAEFFFVGDDWQAINGFAGSDLKFFQEFQDRFRNTAVLNVTTNYRSPQSVVDVGNALMSGLGAPAVPDMSNPGWLRTLVLSEFRPTAAERAHHNGDEATPALLRLIKLFLDKGRDVVILCRRNGVPWYVSYSDGLREGQDGLERFAEHLRSFLPDEDRKHVSVSTVHKYKGLEKEAVVIPDADEGSYPLIHPNWVFLRVFGDSLAGIVAEERRLFYVALTRSKHSLAIVSDSRSSQSRYLADIQEHMDIDDLNWKTLPPVPSQDGARVEVRVSNAYDVRDQLKELGYRWNDPGKYWYRTMMADGFDLGTLCQQRWAVDGVRIDVYSEAEELLESKGARRDGP